MRTADHDVLIVGGGTAGCVLARRLSDDPARTVCLVEAGPDDRGEPRALQIRRWSEMIESEYDRDYRSVPQVAANSYVRHARARILGGCSSHNNMIAWRPPVSDLREWVSLGATSLAPEQLLPMFDRLLTRIEPVAPEHRNAFVRDVIESAVTALGIPDIGCFDAEPTGNGVGFFAVGYHPESGVRSSASVSYLHEVMDTRSNLTVLEDANVDRLLFTGTRATGVLVRDETGGEAVITAREIVVWAGQSTRPRCSCDRASGLAMR